MAINAEQLEIGKNYKWQHQPERLVYLGKDGSWHQFALIEKPGKVWCEVFTHELKYFEEVETANQAEK